jgi:hypothetical protein
MNVSWDMIEIIAAQFNAGELSIEQYLDLIEQNMGH